MAPTAYQIVCDQERTPTITGHTGASNIAAVSTEGLNVNVSFCSNDSAKKSPTELDQRTEPTEWAQTYRSSNRETGERLAQRCRVSGLWRLPEFSHTKTRKDSNER
jgi:hypothetical protein